MITTCAYCGGGVSLKDSKIIYGRSYGNIYICDKYPECDAYVGVHKSDGKTPLGTIANKELRELRKICHNNYFDPLWKSGKITRNEAYKFLQRIMGLTAEDCHIAMFNIDQCKELIKKLS